MLVAIILLLLLPAALPLVFWLGGLGLLLTVGFAVERWRYRQSYTAGGRWEATGERFFDEPTQRNVQVYYNPATGERRYVAQEKEPSGK